MFNQNDNDEVRSDNSFELLSVQEVAQKIHVSPSTVRSWINNKQLQVYRFGRVIRVRQIDLREFMDRHILVGQRGFGQTEPRQ